ncbi:MAG: MFS transporter [Dehalococcoidia bacterium]
MSQTAAPATSARPPPRWGALAYPNYRRFWLANVARVFGLQFRFIGAPWLIVTELDAGPAWLGAVGLATAGSSILVSAPAGVLADRMDNKRLILLSQTTSAMTDAVLAFLVLSGVATPWMVVVWATVAGSLGALGNPSLNAILPRLIEMRVVASAVAYTSAIWNTMRILGPVGAGLLIALIGISQALFVTAIGFTISSLLIASVRLAPVQGAAQSGRGGMIEGFRYVLTERVFFATIGLSFFTSLFGASYVILLPVFAEDVLDVGVGGFAAMEAAAGIGALLGTLSIVRLGSGNLRGPLMLVAAAIFGLLIAAFAASRAFPLSLGLLFLGGFASSVYLNLGMTTLQLLVPNELRGRVMGVWSLTWVLASAGGLPAGLLAEWLGAPWAVALGALSVTGFALTLLATVPSLRSLRNVEAPAGA